MASLASLSSNGSGLAAAAAASSSVTTTGSGSAVRLTDAVIKSMKVGKLISEDVGEKYVASMDMQVNGGVAVAAFANHAIVRADLLSGSGNKPKKMFNKQDGVDCVQCTHHNSAVIYAATLGASRGQIIYHSMYDNVILRRFKDHRASVVSLRMSPVSDSFASSSLDGTMRWWDVRAPESQYCGALETKGRSSVAIDPTGKVLAIGLPNGSVHILDVGNLSNGSFANSPGHSRGMEVPCLQLEFSPGNTYIAAVYQGQPLHILDGMELNELATLNSDPAGAGAGMAGCTSVSFSPDESYVTGAFEDGSVRVWSLNRTVAEDDPEKTTIAPKVVRGFLGHAAPKGKGAATGRVVVKWHPNRCVVATGADELAMWIPAKFGSGAATSSSF